MLRHLCFYAGALLIALASVSGYARTHAQDAIDNDAPVRRHARSTRVMRTSTIPVITDQVNVDPEAVFDASMEKPAKAKGSNGLQIQAASPAWPQWGQNPQHTGFLNVAGQALSKILAN